MLFTAGHNSVTAQEKTINELVPKSGWNVNRINGNENTTDSYCALSRQFDQGVVLTLGRNQAQEYSLAIDFQTASLNPDKAVSLTLQPGPGQIRAYEMMPASQRAIVVRLGYDQSFFEALEASRFLKAEVDGQNYQFNIPNIGKGQQQLTDCMQGLGGAETKTASGFSAKKDSNAEPIPEPEKLAAAMPKAEKVIEKADGPEKVIIKAGEEEQAMKDYNADQEKIKADAAKAEAAMKAEAEKAEKAKKEAEAKKMAAAQAAQKATPIIPKPEKLAKADMVEPPKPAEVKTEAKKETEKKTEQAVALKDMSSKEPVSLQPSALSEAPPPPPMPSAVSTKPEMAVKAEEKPAQAVRIEPKISKEVPPVAEETTPIEMAKVGSRKIENNKAQPAAKVEEKPLEKPLEKVIAAQTEKKPTSTSDLNKRELERIANMPKVAAMAPEPKAEMKMAPEPKISAAPKKVEAPKPEKVASTKTTSKAPDTKPEMWNNALQKKQRDELDRLKQENARLNDALKTQVSKPVAQKEADKNTAKVEKLNKQIAKLQGDLAKAKTSKDPADKKMVTELEKLKSENEQLRLAMKAQKIQKEAEAKPAASPMTSEAPQKVAESKVDPAVMKQLDNLKSENQRLSAAMQGQREKMDAFNASSPQAEKELSDMRVQLDALKAENKRLEVEARKTRGEVDTAVVQVGNEALSKIREYEKKLEASRSDNLALSKEIEELRRMQEDSMLSSVAGDWDLEKATKRYNEAEREIKRLGMLLEQQRTAHRQEKADLEGMLFDPAVTEREQRQRLTELELQLAEAEKQLVASGRRMPARPRLGGAPPSSERIAVGMAPMPAPSVQAQSITPRPPQQQMRTPQPMRTPPAQMLPPPMQQQARVQPQPRPQPQMAPPPQQRRQPVAQPVSAPQASGPNFGQNNLQQLLSKAGISVSGRVAKKSNNEYRWSAGKLTGHAEVVPQMQAGSLDSFAQSYIAKAKQSCGGDFASMPSSVAIGRGKSFEVACISPTRSTSSSIVFTQQGGDLIAIAHEASADDLDAAMDARDRVAGSM